MYGKPSNVVSAFLFFFTAAIKKLGITKSFLGDFGLVGAGLFSSDSLRAIAFFTYPIIVVRAGRSFTDVSRPNCPIAPSALSSPTTVPLFQKPNAQCSLKDAK